VQGAEQFALKTVAGPDADVAVQSMEDASYCAISWSDPLSIPGMLKFYNCFTNGKPDGVSKGI
jgi:hypothetical protein